jgi:hypothetical protein
LKKTWPLCRTASSATAFGGTTTSLGMPITVIPISRRSSAQLRLTDFRIGNRAIYPTCGYSRCRTASPQQKLPELGYAKWAAASYETFSLLRDEGKIPKSRKFQVNLPLTSSAIATFFHRPADLSIMARAYEDAARREVSAILEAVPAKELLILWDVCVEILDLEGALPWMPPEGAMQRSAEGAANIVAKIPTDVAVGYHLCYGTLPRWPMVELRDIGTQVSLANALIERSGRPIEVLHLVIPKSSTEAFFDGADKLTSRGADLYLGVIHEDDSIEDNLARVRMARKFLPSFGTSYVCGFGRRSLEDTKRLLSRHREVAAALAAER